MLRKISLLFLSVIYFITSMECQAQVSCWQEARRGSFYLNCGFNSYSSPASTVHIYQAELNNSYDLINPGSQKNSPVSSTSILNTLTYNVGYFFNYNQTWALELSYNPFQYYLTDDQSVHLKGTINSVNVDTNIVYSGNRGNHYYLTNGSCLLQLNIVRRIPIYRDHIRNFSVDIYGKAGIGPVFIKPDILIDSNKVKQPFSMSGGWNADCAGGLRFTFNRHYYVELLVKYVIAYINDIDIYQGFASQNFTTISENFNIGIIFPTTRHNPLFRKGEKKKTGLPTGPEPRGDIDSLNPKPQLLENY